MNDSDTGMSTRVSEMVRLIRAGNRWERTMVDGKPAIRLTGPGGVQTFAVTDDEELEFLAAIGGSVRITLPMPKK